jgi:hypothetical protein
VALQEARKAARAAGVAGAAAPAHHIPYRNSLMTSVLRDSLGGNCKTTMIATINPEPEHTDESISTCRFAQRVARVKNTAVVNAAVVTVRRARRGGAHGAAVSAGGRHLAAAGTRKNQLEAVLTGKGGYAHSLRVARERSVAVRN